MEKFFKFMTFSLFAALIVFASCGGDDDDDNDDGPGTNPAAEVAAQLSGTTWGIDGSPTLESVQVEGWEGFQVTFTGDENGGSFTTSGSADQAVWASSGDWTFTDNTATKALRNDGVTVDITPGDTSLRLEFTIAAGRTNGIVGKWSFTFSR